MKRRSFLVTLSGLPALIFTPSLALPTKRTGLDFTDAVDVEIVDIPAEVRYWESHVQTLNGNFSWEAHNELRHHYRSISPKRSMMHSDSILANSVMDDYVLHTLSEWHMDTAPIQAIGQLWDKAETYASLVHLRAACLIKAGDLCKSIGSTARAEKLYRLALATGGLMPVSTLKPYRQLAQARLGGSEII